MPGSHHLRLPAYTCIHDPRVRGSSGLCMCARQIARTAPHCSAEQRRRLVLCMPVLAWSLSPRVGRPVHPRYYRYMYRDKYHHRHRTTLHHPQKNIPPSRRRNKSHGPMPRAAWGRATSGALKSLAPELLKPRGKPERCRVPVTVRLFLVSAVAPVEDAPQSTHPQPPAPVISRRRRGGLRVCAMRG